MTIQDPGNDISSAEGGPVDSSIHRSILHLVLGYYCLSNCYPVRGEPRRCRIWRSKSFLACLWTVTCLLCIEIPVPLLSHIRLISSLGPIYVVQLLRLARNFPQLPGAFFVESSLSLSAPADRYRSCLRTISAPLDSFCVLNIDARRSFFHDLITTPPSSSFA